MIRLVALRKELRKVISEIESSEFQLPCDAWWIKRKELIQNLKQKDVEIINDVKDLYRVHRRNTKLASRILNLAIRLKEEIEKMESNMIPQRIKIIKELIKELDIFLKKELTIENLGVEFNNFIAYHGSATSNIRSFNIAEDYTVGAGIYLTDKNSAIGYAKIRAQTGGEPIVYEFLLHNLLLADLRNDYAVRVSLTLYKDLLIDLIQKGSRPWYVLGAWKKAVDVIASKKVFSGTIKTAIQTNGHIFSKFLSDYGYEGLIAREGGEGPIGDHISYVIFNPSKIKLLREILIKVPR